MLTATAIRTIALAGNPNSGKTTIFNALTGLRQKTGNYPGVTVEKRLGRMRAAGEPGTLFDVIDLPGTYSLISGSPDEKVAVDVLTGKIAGTHKPDVVIVVVDASNLQRNLYLVSQLIEMQVPLVVALNMMDVAERRGLHVQAELLQAKLGVPVVPVVGHKARGIDMLKRAIPNAAIPNEPDWPLPLVFQRAVTTVASELGYASKSVGLSPRAHAERLLVGEILAGTTPRVSEIVQRQREQLITAGIDPMQTDVEAHYQWIDSVANAVTRPTVDLRIRGTSAPLVTRPQASLNHERGAHATPTLDYAPRHSLTERVDRILLHKVWGLLAFTAIMAGIFMAIFFAAAPLMDATENGIGWVGELVAGWLPDGTLKDMWTDAIVAGVGGVLVFVPQIAILFGLLAILEDSGYLARAAFIMDRILGKVGLGGKAFVPMLSGFACAIPGVMAARTIASPRDRLRTIFVLPFMSCSARLPVYTLLIGAFFASYAWWVRGGIMLGLYLLGIIAAFGTAWVWKRRSHEAVSSFLMELPSYKIPQATTVARVMYSNTRAFVVKAGTIIFALSVILWATTYWPRLPEGSEVQIKSEIRDAMHVSPRSTDLEQAFQLYRNKRPAEELVFNTPADEAAYQNQLIDEFVEVEVPSHIASAQLRHSLAGRFGHLIEPALKPLGFDWKMGVGMVGAFGAREVFVGFMGIVYAAGDDENTDPLATAMQTDKYADGTSVWRPLVAINMLVWFVLAMQCLSTVAIVKRETGGWKWPLLQLVYMNGLAYVVCLVIYQVGKALGA